VRATHGEARTPAGLGRRRRGRVLVGDGRSWGMTCGPQRSAAEARENGRLRRAKRLLGRRCFGPEASWAGWRPASGCGLASAWQAAVAGLGRAGWATVAGCCCCCWAD
jgi:hypothetical protein